MVKLIDGFPNYFVTDDGRVYSWNRGRFLKSRADNHNRTVVKLCNHGKGGPHHVHRLVLEAFVGPCPEGMECRHLDGKPANNNLNNLRWGSPKENAADRELHGRTAKGERNGLSKLTADNVQQIRSLYATGNFTHRGLAARFGGTYTNIGYIIRRKTWKHIA